MIEAFEFTDAGRTFECEPRQGAVSQADTWWWFRVSTDDRHRYAPFRAEGTDTEWSVRTRVVAYYDDLLIRRGLPHQR